MLTTRTLRVLPGARAQGNLSQARASRTMANPQYPAVKLIHYAASRRLELPLALTKLVLYLAFLG